MAEARADVVSHPAGFGCTHHSIHHRWQQEHSLDPPRAASAASRSYRACGSPTRPSTSWGCAAARHHSQFPDHRACCWAPSLAVLVRAGRQFVCSSTPRGPGLAGRDLAPAPQLAVAQRRSAELQGLQAGAALPRPSSQACGGTQLDREFAKANQFLPEVFGPLLEAAKVQDCSTRSSTRCSRLRRCRISTRGLRFAARGC